MKIRSLVLSIGAIALMSLLPVNLAIGQNTSAPIKSVQSTGVTLSISKLSLSHNSLMIQFVMTNNTKARVYIVYVSRTYIPALLGSGERSQSIDVSGIEQCPHTLTECIGDSRLKDVNNLSYIEPGEFIVFSFIPSFNSAVMESDTVSFSAPFVARFAVPGQDPSEPANPKGIRFNFSYVPLTPH